MIDGDKVTKDAVLQNFYTIETYIMTDDGVSFVYWPEFMLFFYKRKLMF